MPNIIKEAIKIIAEKKEPIKNAIGHPFVLKKIFEMRKHIYTKITDLKATVSTTDEPVLFKDRLSLSYKPIIKGEKWGGFFDCAWFNFKGEIDSSYMDKELYLNIDINGEGCIFDDDGTPLKGITGVLSFMDFMGSIKGKHLYKMPDCNGQINIWVDAGNNGFLGLSSGDAKLREACVVTINQKLYKLYYDYLAIYLLLLAQDKESDRFIAILDTLKKVTKLLKNYTDEEMDNAELLIAPLLSQKSEYEFEFFATGHAHLDLAWLWPIRETKRKAARTFSNQLDLIERFDDYVFGASQPQQFEWVKELYPALYKKLKLAVKNDKLELQGGMWVEADTNLSGAESLVRQALYGKRFFNKEFKKNMKILWLPDVFGFSGALPQIMKKTGMDYFLTIKLYWNKINKFPYHSFIWQGIDNSQVLVHMPPEGNYVSDGNPIAVIDGYNKYINKDTNCALMLYGVGDGGGGPGEPHFEVLKREKDLLGMPKVRPAKAVDFFDKLSAQKENLPTIKGELYLETHQGTLTTQANNKLLNRKIENALRDSEFFATVAMQKGYKYPKAQLEKIWKEVLLYQFHDIIPGSSIQRVYSESVARYRQMLEELKTLNEEIFKHLSDDKLDTSYINTLSYPRKEYIKEGDNWSVINALPFSTAKAQSVEQTFLQMACGIRFIENNKYRLFFNRDGSIKALFEKATNRNFAGKHLNRLTVYKDKKTFYNAWDIDINYTKRLKRYFRLVSFENILDGATVIRRSNYKYNKSTIVQDVILKYDCDIIEFKTQVDWQETHKMLRADFRPSFFADKVTCNIQWGNIERSTKTDNLIDYAQHEICAHKFVYVEETKRGFALLNDSKYGHRVKDGLISLNLLRSPVYPDETADKGVHNFSYAVFAKSGISINDVTEKAYIFNNPLIATDYNIDIFNKIRCSNKNIIVETVKAAEDSDDIILRVYESAGIETRTEIEVNFEYNTAYECDMLEKEEKTITLSSLKFLPYEIKTIKLKGN